MNKMTELKSLLKNLIEAPGLSGYEAPIRKIIEEIWEPLTDELITSKLGSLHGLKRGKGAEPRPSILIATHMDAIGMMVTRIKDGFLHITEIGGIDARVLPGQPVTVFGRKELSGIIAQPPSWLLPRENRKGAIPIEKLIVDTGLSPRQVNQLVRVGDIVSFAQPPLELGGDLISGHSLDNRASVVALTHCMEMLQNREHFWDVWAVATVQEEETLGGAATSAYQIRPHLAIVIDVTHAKGPGTPAHKTFDMGKGPVLGWGPNVHPGIHKAIKDTANRIEMATQLEVMPRHSGTDAISLQITTEGIPTMIISIPLRYMHTPVEVVHLKDVSRVGRLLAEFITELDPSFMDKLVWEDENQAGKSNDG